MIELRLSGSPGEVRIALLEDDTLVDVALWRPGAPDGWGNIYDVRVKTVVPSLDGAFIQTDQGADGFLTSRKKITEGSLLCAQLIRCAQNGKGARFKPIARPASLPPATEPRLLQCGPSALEELVERAPHAPIIVDDMTVAAALPAALKSRVQRVPKSFDTVLEGEWDALMQPSASLGPFIAHFSPTPALTAIDLDSASHPDFATNVACFPELLRHIRLRNLSGTLLIDPAGVRSRKRPALVPFLKKAVEQEKDPLQPRVTGVTPSGLLELTRPRRRPPLHELMRSPHGQGLAILRQIIRDNLPGQTLHAPPEIVHALEEDPDALSECVRTRCQPLALHVAPPSSSCCWNLS
ncbi:MULTISPECIES: ribonuclease E/G [unclassified Saccharibacter]|uniref:ribonuclease E/G n=1 Tax=unclassified Saccharibacter TaxID=2648722 RepID=UPI001325686C|nr:MULTISPECIES: ribonuclease E/G [unclassified Saccharibacter]MXV36443.1 hypothetical protein [Saccharibacter sp. EH611]MXV57605.1 hypothetical protein [Saccharibacter sp. EH70]MXV65088.1 hypothetical protein [Saccharibacter sp. EH60]